MKHFQFLSSLNSCYSFYKLFSSRISYQETVRISFDTFSFWEPKICRALNLTLSEILPSLCLWDFLLLLMNCYLSQSLSVLSSFLTLETLKLLSSYSFLLISLPICLNSNYHNSGLSDDGDTFGITIIRWPWGIFLKPTQQTQHKKA